MDVPKEVTNPPLLKVENGHRDYLHIAMSLHSVVHHLFAYKEIFFNHTAIIYSNPIQDFGLFVVIKIEP